MSSEPEIGARLFFLVWIYVATVGKLEPSIISVAVIVYVDCLEMLKSFTSLSHKKSFSVYSLVYSYS